MALMGNYLMDVVEPAGIPRAVRHSLTTCVRPTTRICNLFCHVMCTSICFFYETFTSGLVGRMTIGFFQTLLNNNTPQKGTVLGMSDTLEETILTNDGHKYTGTLRMVPGIAGLVLDGRGTMHYTNGDVYVGEWSKNERSGSGTLKYADGSVYDGEWLKDKRHGCGQLQRPDGSSYEGSFEANERHGMGIEKLSNGEDYTGSFQHGVRSGRGMLVLPNGQTFKGQFSKNAMNGPGTLVFPNGDTLTGNFVNNATHGEGTFYFANGDVYEGFFENGVRTRGSLTTRNGVKFTGHFSVEGNLEKMIDAASGAEYVLGRWENVAAPNGAAGSKEWKDGQGTIQSEEGKYVGDYQEALRHGYGVMEYSNGDHYEGWWANGLREGEGKMTWYRPTVFDEDHHGWRYIGHWKAGKFHGHGELWYDVEGGKYSGYFEEGRRHGCGHESVFGDQYEGDFVSGRRHGKGVLTTRTGDKFSGTFSNGECLDSSATVEYANGDRFVGGVVGLQRHGDGRLVYANGDDYNGEFQDHLRHGVGLLVCANGDSYQGQWKKDKMDGSGTFTYADGTVYDGRFSNGVKHGTGTLIIPPMEDNEEQRFEVVYRDNVLVSRAPKE
jgi:hypothetical protein